MQFAFVKLQHLDAISDGVGGEEAEFIADEARPGESALLVLIESPRGERAISNGISL